MYEFYQIRPGDTIESIGVKYDVGRDTLSNLNPNSSFTVGETIIVPTIGKYFEIYKIEKGDSLYKIAKEYNTDYNLLALLNGINVSDFIYPDTNILVPKKDVKYYITKDNDTLLGVNNLLGGNMNTLLRENNNIYLKEGQLIVYKD